MSNAIDADGLGTLLVTVGPQTKPSGPETGHKTEIVVTLVDDTTKITPKITAIEVTLVDVNHETSNVIDHNPETEDVTKAEIGEEARTRITTPDINPDHVTAKVTVVNVQITTNRDEMQPLTDDGHAPSHVTEVKVENDLALANQETIQNEFTPNVNQY